MKLDPSMISRSVGLRPGPFMRRGVMAAQLQFKKCRLWRCDYCVSGEDRRGETVCKVDIAEGRGSVYLCKRVSEYSSGCR